MQQRFFIAGLTACSTCFGHHYTHHQELKSGCCLWYFVLWFSSCWSGVELRVMCPVCRMLAGKPASILQTGHIQQPLCNTLELLMMGIMVTETCWARNKICNKNFCCIWGLCVRFAGCCSILQTGHITLNTTMPIIRRSRVLYSGYCLWYFMLCFSSCCSGAELRVMCPVCRMLAGKPVSILQTGHIQQPLYNTLELLMMGIVVPETCWASNKIFNKKNLCCI